MASKVEGSVPGPPAGGQSDLQALARRHLWMHFTHLGAYSDESEIPVIVRGTRATIFSLERTR